MVQDDPERKLEVWLDEALARYNVAEPRPGLERRVLERLRAEKRGLPRRGWRAWAPALATAAAVIVVTVAVVLRNRVPEIASDQAPAVPLEKAARVQAQEAKGTSSPQESAGMVKAPPSKILTGTSTVAGETRPRKARIEVIRETTAASRVMSSAHVGSEFPMPAALSEQERLAIAALRSGVLDSEQPRIPPSDEPLPEVMIEEIEIRPLQEIKPIGKEGV